jgi:hypothetical protein
MERQGRTSWYQLFAKNPLQCGHPTTAAARHVPHGASVGSNGSTLMVTKLGVSGGQHLWHGAKKAVLMLWSRGGCMVTFILLGWQYEQLMVAQVGTLSYS